MKKYMVQFRPNSDVPKSKSAAPQSTAKVLDQNLKSNIKWLYAPKFTKQMDPFKSCRTGKLHIHLTPNVVHPRTGIIPNVTRNGLYKAGLLLFLGLTDYKPGSLPRLSYPSPRHPSKSSAIPATFPRMPRP